LYREYRGELAKVGDRLQKLIQDYAVTYETATAEQAKAMVDEMLSIQRAELKAKETYLPKFRKVIPELKVARFLQIENKIDTLIKLDLAANIPLIGPAK
jgi:polyhydroxyalkanoate synthesis regulator phasin